MLLASFSAAQAQARDTPEGSWFTQGRGGVVKIAPCGSALCGVIIGLSEWPPHDVLRDVHGTPQCHLTLLRDLRLEDDQRWHGTVTNPKDGQVYDAEIWVPADGIMRLRGYIGIPLLGTTQLWPPFTGTVTSDCHFSAGP
jgi:uncharacterized protein (DUF2147 family)